MPENRFDSLREPLNKSGRINLRFKMIKIKAWNARNSTAIAKFHKASASLLTPLTYIRVGDAEIDYFGLKLIGHDLFRGFLSTAPRRYRLELPAPKHNRVPGIP